jgi:hypothetical protein
MTWRDRSRAELVKISDPGDREGVEGDLATLSI